MTDMLGALLAALRPILAVILIGGTTTVIVAPAFDMASARLASQAASGNGAVQQNHPSATPAPTDDPQDADENTPEPTPKVDLEAILRACLDTRDPDSSECARAQEHSGLSFEDFRAKILAKLETPKPDATKKPEPVATKPQPVATKKPQTPSPEADFATYFEKCLATRDINSDICFRAEQLSGLSREEFDAKFAAKLAAKDGGDFWTWFDKCLATRNVTSDACVRAQQLIGFNDADFHAKFDRYLAERDATTAKTGPTPKPATATLETLVKACGEARNRMSEACLKALVVSGLQPKDFWAKIEALFGHFD